MRTLCLLITFSISAFLFTITTSGQSTYTWNGTTGNWNEATNWTPNGIPGEVDTALISAEGDYTVTLNIDTTVAKIILGGESGAQTLSMTNRIITIVEDIEVGSNGILSLTSTTLTGYGTLSNSGTFTSTALILNMEFENEGSATFNGTTDLNDTIITNPGALIQVKSYSNIPIQFTSAKGFVNNGVFRSLTYNYWGGGFMEILDGTLTNSMDGSIEISAPGTLSSSSSAFSVKTEIDNQGALTINHNTILDKQDAQHQNSGTFSIANKAITITQVGTISAFENSGTISVGSESRLTINGGTFTHSSGNLDVTGSLAINNTIVNIIPEFTNNMNLSLTGCTLNCTASFSNQEALSLINTEVNGSELFTNEDTLYTRGVVMNMGIENLAMLTFAGDCEINDTLITNPGTLLQVTSYSNIPIQFSPAQGIVNKGRFEFITYNYWGGGLMEITNGVFVNEESAVLHFKGTTNVSSSATDGKLRAQLVNHGEVIIDHNTNFDKESANHLNYGSLVVNNHKFTLIQTGTTPTFTNHGTMLIDSTSYFTINGGTFEYNEGEFVQKGIMNVNNATLNLIPDFTNSSSLTFTNSTINCSAALTNNSDLALNNSVINGDSFFTNLDTLSVNGIELNMDFNNQGMATFSGNVDINDTLITNPGTRLDISSYTGGPINFTSAKGFTNSGLLQCLQYNYWGGGTFQITNGSLVNSEEGTFNILVLAVLSSASSPFNMVLKLNNNGTMYLDHSTNLSLASVVHENSGQLTIEDKIFTINQAGTSFINQEHGILGGNGTLTFTDVEFENYGRIDPGLSPGILTINADLSQEASSQINIELAGLTAGTLHDQLNISGAASLNGHINIHLLDEYNPIPGDVFNIMGYSSVTGNFTDSSGFYPGTGIIFNLEQTATNLNLITSAHDNSPPHIVNPVSDIQIDEDFEIFTAADLDTIFDDIDIPLGDRLEYSIALLDNKVEASLNVNELQLSSIANINGAVSVVITATDAGSEMAKDTFELIILPVNDPPALADGIPGKWDISLDEDFADVAAADLDTLFTDIDLPDGDSLSFDFQLKGALLSASMDGSVITLQSQANAFGTDTLLLIATDKGLMRITDTLIIHISAINDAPVLAEGIPGKWDIFLDEDFADMAAADLDTLFTDIDLPDGDSLTYSYQIKGALLSASLDGPVITLKSHADAFGTDTLILLATDKGLSSISDTVIIHISGMNDAPEAFSLLSPSDGSSIDESETLYFDWEESTDVEEDIVEYTLHLSSSGWDTSIVEISSHSYTLTNASSLASNTRHEWSVTATDGTLETASNETFAFTTPAVSGIQNEYANTGLKLEQNYPNPFVHSTSIDFNLPNTGRVAIKIYDMTGKLVHTLVNEERAAGSYSEQLNFSNYASGIYLYKLETESQSIVKKMTKME